MWAAKMRKLANDESLSEETWSLLVQNAEEKIDFVEARLQKVRKSQILEIQRAEKWLRDFASTTLQLLHGEEDFEDGDSCDTYDEDESMPGLEGEQPGVSHQVDFPMQDAEPEQDGQEQEQEQHDSVMGDQLEISPEPSHNKYRADKLAQLENLLLAKKHDLIIVRDASRTAQGQLDGKLQQADAAPNDDLRPCSSVPASSLATMPADQTQTLAQQRSASPAVPVFRGAFLFGRRA
ncbi:hypothetical protein J3459_002411 [Metarhizium acridum]|uniref:uncharacterized protein n=1 Tax=Metarhizium acridum TaxID=92637 RepID=UPI001C6BD959|nr:hypothetical protein J3458_001391 [Metarhizium acridum]KAG8428780.1 hypothetical protein J3459_002411 [Metarhizium acridum]